MIDALAIHRLKRDYQAGEPMWRMAELYGLGETQIAQRAKEGKWTRPDATSPPPPTPTPEPTPAPKPAAKGDAWHGEIKARARCHFAAGCSVSCVSTRVGVPLPTVRRWVQEEVWTRTAPSSTVAALLRLPPEQVETRIAELLQAEQDLAALREKHAAQTAALAQVRDDYHADDRRWMREREDARATIAELRAQSQAVTFCPACCKVAERDADGCCMTCEADLIVLADQHSADLLIELTADR